MHRISIAIAFVFSALSLPLAQGLIAGLVGMDFEPRFDMTAAVSSLFWVGVAIYFKIGQRV